MPSPVHIVPDDDTAVYVPLGEDYLFMVWILSNPFPIITPQSWSFTDYNGTLQPDLADNVNSLVYPDIEKLTIEARLVISNIEDINYGTYELTANNAYGHMVQVTFIMLHNGKYINVDLF